MILGLQSTMGEPLNPAVRLAAGTLLDLMEEAHGPAVFRELSDVAVTVSILAAGAEPARAPGKPGRVGHRKAEGILTTDVILDPWTMVEAPVMEAQPGAIAASRDHVRAFAGCVEAALDVLVAWCDRKDAWVDRARFVARRDAALAALRTGAFARPGEFAATAAVRDALDATWALLVAEPWETEAHSEIAGAYLALRDVGWRDAASEPDPDAPLLDGQPQLRLAADPPNLASAPPPRHRSTYSIV